MSWNPSAVGTVGNEWRVWQSGATSPDPVGVYVNSSVTETIDSLLVPYTAAGAPSSYGRLWADVYNAADLGVNETPVVSTFLPNEDTAATAMYYQPVGGSLTGPISGGASNLDQYIDDATNENLPLSALDFLAFLGAGSARFAMGTVGLGAGRVLSVVFEVAVVNNYSAGTVRLDLYNGSTLVTTLAGITVAGGDQSQAPRVESRSLEFFVNPLTGDPWTRDDIINMDTGSNLLLQLSGQGTGTVYVTSLRIKVKMISEKRVAMGGNTYTTAPPIGVQTANVCSLKTPALADNWAKASATDYLIVIRRPYGYAVASFGLPFQTFTFHWGDSGAANPHDQGHGYGVTADPYTGQLTATSGLETKAYGLLMARTDAALSVDSQVYHHAFGQPITSTQAATQRFSNHGSVSYATVRAIVGVYQTESVQPTGDLLIKIKRNSDNVQMGGTATLTLAALTSHTFLGTSATVDYYDVQLQFASAATLVAGTQYYLELTTTSPTPNYWVVRALGYEETHSFTGDQSYGGSTDVAGPYAQSDLAATITTAPATAPATITVTTSNQALPAAGEPLCPPGVHAAAHVAWATTSEGVLFARYEIQRSEDGGVTWVLVKRVATESTLSFDDVEAARAIPVQYRIRVVRTNGQASDWRTQTGTITLARNSASVVFASNSAPTLTVGYLWLGNVHDYEFLGDDEISLVRMHERDFQAEFRPIEDRGVGYTFTLLIHTKTTGSAASVQPPGGRGAAAYDAFRAVIEHDSPYTTVFTPDGVRLFASVRLPTGRRTEAAAHYTANVSVVQVASTPSPSDV